ncbi:MAG: PilZ domain-containing protein [Planctomycetota bacterium]
MLTDRRELERNSVPFADSVAWFSLNDRLYPAHLVNRSSFGVGVTIRQRPPVAVGEFVSLEWLKPTPDVASVVVRSIQQLGEDEWYVGLEFQDIDVSNASAIRSSRNPGEYCFTRVG